MSLKDVFDRASQQIDAGEHVIVEFLAGDWAKVKHLFEGTSIHATVIQEIPKAASVTVKVKKTELDTAKETAATQEERAPEPVAGEDSLVVESNEPNPASPGEFEPASPGQINR
jgi:hypothetical protein